MKYLLFLLLFLSGNSLILGQTKSTFPIDIAKVVQLDSVTVKAVRKGFKVSDFIEMVQRDTSFGQAFTNLRFANHLIDSRIFFYNKKEKQIASLERQSEQFVDGNCRWMTTIEEKSTGKMFKNRRKKQPQNEQFKYYTSQLFEHTFLTKDTVCRGDRSATTTRNKSAKGMEKRKQQLKTLIFNPGAPIEGLPLIERKLAIFDQKMMPFYDYSIASVDKRGRSCYAFKVVQKKELKRRKANKVVIDNLISYFDKKTFEIVARSYDLSYSSLLFDFDVLIYAELDKFEGQLVPVHLTYEGFWDIPMKKPEIAKFDVKISEVSF